MLLILCIAGRWAADCRLADDVVGLAAVWRDRFTGDKPGSSLGGKHRQEVDELTSGEARKQYPSAWVTQKVVSSLASMLRRTGHGWVPTSSSSSTSLFPDRLERLGEVMVMVGCRSVGSVPPTQGSVLIFTPFIGAVVISSSEPIMRVGWQLCVGVAVSAGRTH